MTLIENDRVVQTFAADGSDDAFDERILPRRPGRDHDFFDTHPLTRERKTGP
jgi:hypothetical protein